MPDRIEQITCADIEVPADRYRKDMGDLQGLADSIETVGQLHPIGVMEDSGKYRLVFGERRLRAARDVLRWETIPARIFDLDLDTSRQVEHDENEHRKALTLGERHALWQVIRLHKEERRGRPATGSTASQNAAAYAAKIAQLPAAQLGGISKPNETQDDAQRETRDIVARAAGFGSDQEASRVHEVIAHGTPALIQAMEDEEVAVSAAAVIATETPEEQARIVSLDSGRRRHEVKRLRQQRRTWKPTPPLTQGEQIYLLMQGIERLGSTQLDSETVAREYASYSRVGTRERIRLAIMFLQKLERSYPRYDQAAKQEAI
jgi:ParB/RepB/Spo0J family partition protein